MTKLHHPNLLPLLAHAVVPDSSNGRMLQLVYMLFPVYEASRYSFTSQLPVPEGYDSGQQLVAASSATARS